MAFDWKVLLAVSAGRLRETAPGFSFFPRCIRYATANLQRWLQAVVLISAREALVRRSEVAIDPDAVGIKMTLMSAQGFAAPGMTPFKGWRSGANVSG
jgi:hypothetical protein